MVKLVWTELSTEDLKEIFDYIAKDSSRYASITVNKIYNRAQDIIDNPYVGRVVPEINIKVIREVISGNYRIVYKIINDFQVDILRVYHSARLLKADRLE
ncbi:MAG: type II toxin-antitoxin system mRNA interferase toxin, RelE/StbE family [Bacteroidetes bacterium]|jgi:addiction module RelE/StbE family toxin|nr:type II toxin-antitoxin system mRNA interferase toxin, RelE/StbE family [Bacteroidota bacterium]